MENWEIRSQKSNLKVSMHLPILVINISKRLLDLLVTINNYTVRGIDKLVRKQSVYGRTQNLYINSDRQMEQRC